MSIQVRRIRFYVLPMKTRFPFKYGIANMTELPHLFVLAEVEMHGKTAHGISSDGLPPKWFTKDPQTTFEEDLPEMLRVIRHAADLSLEVGRHRSFFSWWKAVYDRQADWAIAEDIASLLAGLGVSLMERAVLDAFCRVHETSVFQVLKENRLAVELGQVRPSLQDVVPADVLPESPLTSVQLRHTIGLGDPLTDGDISPEEALADGLPHSLVENIRAYGLRYFKIKLSGNREQDQERLLKLAEIIQAEVHGTARFTLDGNENFRDIHAFREHWDAHQAVPALGEFFGRSLLFVEQPLHRDYALEEGVKSALQSWPDAPPIIIDESDGSLDSLPRALELGYVGTSHKNAKGIIKGLTNAGTIALARRNGHSAVLSAEDLANVGPVALLQDLAMVASFGIPHVERNGHHYFAGLSMFDRPEQDRVLRHHADLYKTHENKFVCLSVEGGKIQLESVTNAPFGVAEHPNLADFEIWDF